MAMLKSLMKFCWLSLTRTIFASSNPYYLDFTINFLALVILSKSCFIFPSQVNKYMYQSPLPTEGISVCSKSHLNADRLVVKWSLTEFLHEDLWVF